MLIQCNVTVQAPDESIWWKIAEVLSPVLLFSAGYLVSWISQNRKDKKHKLQTTEIVKAWVNEIELAAHLNYEVMYDIYHTKIEDGEEILSLEFEFTPVDRLLSISDKDLLLAINNTDIYLLLTASLYQVKKAQIELEELYEEFKKEKQQVFRQIKSDNAVMLKHIKIMAQRGATPQIIQEYIAHQLTIWETDEYVLNFEFSEMQQFLEDIRNRIFENVIEQIINENSYLTDFLSLKFTYQKKVEHWLDTIKTFQKNLSPISIHYWNLVSSSNSIVGHDTRLRTWGNYEILELRK